MDSIKKIMLISPDTVKSASYVNYNVDDGTIGASIREGQEIHLQSIIGSNMLYRLQQLVKAQMDGLMDGIDAEENELYKELLDDYIEPYLANKIQALLCMPISMKIRNLGVVKTGDTNVDGPSLKDVMALQTRYNGMAARYATYLSKYLCAHVKDFPELTQGDCGCGLFIKPVLGKTFVETGLVLGGNDSVCGC